MIVRCLLCRFDSFKIVTSLYICCGWLLCGIKIRIIVVLSSVCQKTVSLSVCGSIPSLLFVNMPAARIALLLLFNNQFDKLSLHGAGHVLRAWAAVFLLFLYREHESRCFIKKIGPTVGMSASVFCRFLSTGFAGFSSRSSHFGNLLYDIMLSSYIVVIWFRHHCVDSFRNVPCVGNLIVAATLWISPARWRKMQPTWLCLFLVLTIDFLRCRLKAKLMQNWKAFFSSTVHVVMKCDSWCVVRTVNMHTLKCPQPLRLIC